MTMSLIHNQGRDSTSSTLRVFSSIRVFHVISDNKKYFSIFIDRSYSVDRINCSLVTQVNRQRQSEGY